MATNCPTAMNMMKPSWKMNGRASPVENRKSTTVCGSVTSCLKNVSSLRHATNALKITSASSHLKTRAMRKRVHGLIRSTLRL